jgi:hypothetical protein
VPSPHDVSKPPGFGLDFFYLQIGTLMASVNLCEHFLLGKRLLKAGGSKLDYQSIG